MTAEQLRKSILQYAIEGKLVPQNPNDEPASVLLQKIQKEKQKLIADGKLKKDKNESFIYKSDDGNYIEKIGKKEIDITEEIPFELPNNWEWIRLNQLAELTDNEQSNGEKLPYLEVAFLRGKMSPKIIDKGRIVEKGDYLILVDGENSGELFENKIKGYRGSTFKILKFSENIYIPYIKMIIKFNHDLFKNNKRGAAIPHLNKQIFKNLLVALPPLEEQKRIVEKIEQLEPLIAEYDKLEKQATKIDSEIKDKLKKSILQYAIEGKLVPQNADDEPASVLLEKIKAEKKKQLGKKFVDSYIYKADDGNYYENIKGKETNITKEIPFEIPNNWKWCRFDNIITLISGRDLSTSDYSNKKQVGIPYITGASNFYNGTLLINRWTNKPMVISNRGDLLITCKGTIGETAENIIGDCHIARQVMAIKPIMVEKKYINYYISQIIDKLKSKATSFIPGISRETILEILIPIPPLEEQKRIVDKIEQIFELLK